MSHKVSKAKAARPPGERRRVRNVVPCTHRPPCPGCPRYGESGIAESSRALLEDLAAASGARLDDIVEGAPLAFRVRARLAVRGRAASPKLGIFQEGTHAIADIPSCTIQHPRINEAARAIRQAVRRTGTPPYAERPHAGLLRYVQLVVERTSGRVQVVLVTNDASAGSILPVAGELQTLLGDRLQGLWWNGNPERGNAIFGPSWELLAGEGAVRERIGGADVCFPPGAFGQSNLDLADRLVADLHGRIGQDGIVAELYCGVGAIGLGLVERSREVRFNEASPHGLHGLELGLAALPAAIRSRASIAGGEAAGAARILEDASCVILDPPRKGLDDAVVDALRAERPAQVLYVSCEPRSLVRDAGQLARGGCFTLARLTPYALFPYTEHVETIAEFRREQPAIGLAATGAIPGSGC